MGPGEEGFPKLPQDLMEQEVDQPVQNLFVGAMINLGPVYDLGLLSWEKKKKEEAMKLWTDFFSKGNPNCLHVKVPRSWFQFFTVLLLSPQNFDWAKHFVTSKAADHLNNYENQVSFFLPSKCLASKALPCINTPVDPDQKKQLTLEELEEESTPKKKASKRGTPVVDTELRRSARLRQVSQGFKASSCKSKEMPCMMS